MADEVTIHVEVENEESKKKELEVAEIMCGITKKSTKTPRKLIAVTGGDGQVFLKEDIQQTAIDDHHHRQAEQITGATPFHLQKLADGHTIQIAPRQMIRTIPHNLIQVSSGQSGTQSYQVQYATNGQAYVTEQSSNQEIELVECIQTKSERQDTNEQFQQVFMTANTNNSNSMDYQQSFVEQNNEPQEFVYDEEIIQNESFENQSQVVQISNEQQYQQYTIVNESELNSESTNQQDITYYDEQGTQIGSSSKAAGFLKQKSTLPPVYVKTETPLIRKKQINPNRAQSFNVLNSDGQVIQLQSSGSLLNQNPQKSNQQVMFAYQTILLPQSNNQQYQVQSSNIRRVHVQQKGNQRNQILFLQNSGSNNTLKLVGQNIDQNINQNQIKIIKVSDLNCGKSNLLDIAASSAGIDLKSEAEQSQSTVVPFGNGDKKNPVQSHHAYPSPFSQIPINDRVHQCKYCYKRFARADECKRHERIHTDTRPFCCTYCPRRFTRKDHLRTHTRCHTKEKPYSCPLCQRGFARSDERIRHIKTHVKKGECTLEEARAKLGNNQVGRRPTKHVKDSTISVNRSHDQIPITSNTIPLTLGANSKQIFYSTGKGNLILQDIDQSNSPLATVVQIEHPRIQDVEQK